MASDSLSRRRFLSSLATTAAAVTLPNTASSIALGTPVTGAGLLDRHVASKPIKIICTEKLSVQHIEQIKAAGKDIVLHTLTDQSELKKHIADVEVILGPVDAALIPAAKQLKWVQTFAAGVEKMSPELKQHPCQVTNMQRVFAPVIAESAIALLLSLTRGLAQVSIPAFGQRKWQQPPKDIILEDLYGKTIGMVGMGGIGSETARRLHYGFNMRVLGTDAKPLPKPEFVAELQDPAWLMEMVPQVDVLMSAAPLTNETKLMFNAAVFSKMKPSAYFINMSRGGLVDQDALVKALKEKQIRGAGLDVTTPEPLPAESPLWTCPNLVITPHNSTIAPIRQVRAVAMVTENVRRYSNGLPLKNVVDKQKGY
jgi:phosphoglycerate dehydrogenase-like enzyme